MRSTLHAVVKFLARVPAFLIALPVWTATRILMSISGRHDQFFHWTAQWVSSWPGPLGEYARREVLAQLLEHCPRDVCISYGTVFSHRRTRIGARCYFGVGCNIGLVDMEPDCLLGSGVHLLSGKHQHHIDRADVPVREQGGTFTRIRIGEGTWIGNAAVVLADVGRNCVVGAGSVVTKPLPDGAIAAGNPARVRAWRDGFAPAETAATSSAEASYEPPVDDDQA